MPDVFARQKTLQLISVQQEAPLPALSGEGAGHRQFARFFELTE
jgi:hypothetical protein